MLESCYCDDVNEYKIPIEYDWQDGIRDCKFISSIFGRAKAPSNREVKKLRTLSWHDKFGLCEKKPVPARDWVAILPAYKPDHFNFRAVIDTYVPIGTLNEIDTKMHSDDADLQTDAIVQKLLAQGVSRDNIRMPGSAKHLDIYVANDFDEPLDDFSE